VRWSLADGGDPYALAAAEVSQHRQAPLADGPPFTGGAVGFFGYDCVRAVEPLGEPNPDVLGLPVARHLRALARFPRVVDVVGDRLFLLSEDLRQVSHGPGAIRVRRQIFFQQFRRPV